MFHTYFFLPRYVFACCEITRRTSVTLLTLQPSIQTADVSSITIHSITIYFVPPLQFPIVCIIARTILSEKCKTVADFQIFLNLISVFPRTIFHGIVQSLLKKRLWKLTSSSAAYEVRDRSSQGLKMREKRETYKDNTGSDKDWTQTHILLRRGTPSLSSPSIFVVLRGLPDFGLLCHVSPRITELDGPTSFRCVSPLFPISILTI